MKRSLLLMLLAVLVTGMPSLAQTVSDNINVLPVFKSGVSEDPLDYARGDLYGNRQGEPKVAVSTANPDHLLAVFNDFRLVDVPDDPPLPGLLASLPEENQWMLTRYFGVPASAFEEPAYVAGVEAGIGMSVSYDGGLTWIGGFVPGQFPGDTTLASLASPAYGLEGGSDPILLAAPCGRFYLVWLQFIRGDVSMLMAALIQDNNDSDLAHTFTWEHTTLIAEANNATNGPFVDKPEASLSLTGATDCSEITEELNVTWTQFTGQGNISNFQNKLFFGKSVDQARTFDIKKVDDNYTDTSGTATVVDPVTNDIYVFFRSFNPPAMVMTKSTSNGVKWSKPVDLLENVPMAPFDQPTVSILDLPFGTDIKDEIAPRANAFPTAAITPDGSLLMLAWHERVTVVDPLAPLPEAVPDPSAGPKAVMIYSTNGGDTWSDRIAIAPDTPASPPGLGFFNDVYSPVSGPQIQPRASCTAGNPNQCLVIFFESRPYAEPWSNPANPADWNPLTGLSADGFLGGYDRVMDVRGVLIDAPIDGNPFFNDSFQISRYSYRPLLLGEETGETVDYVEEICPPDPDPDDGVSPPCYPSLNYSGYPHTGGGTSPFLHDYLSNDPVVSYVKDAESGKWRVAERPEDVPYGAAFITAFPDNRNVVRPSEDWDEGSLPAEVEDWEAFGIYTPAGYDVDENGQTRVNSCRNPGSRDQNVLTAKISLGLRVTAPTNYKPFVAPVIEFPMTVWNNTADERLFELTILPDPSSVEQPSFAKDDLGDYDQPVLSGAVNILSYSSSSLNVYAFDDLPFTVKVVEVSSCTESECVPVPEGLTGSMTFNAPAYAPPGGSVLDYRYQSSAVAVNPVPRNLSAGNPVPRNPVPRNPVPRNPVPRNTTVEDVIDYSWTVTTTSADDTGTYLTIPNIDKAFQDDYIFQVFITKPSVLRQVSGECDPSNLPLGTLIGHISDPANPVPRNPVPRNPVPRNPVPRNATLSDILVQNTTFTLSSDLTAAGGGQPLSLDSLAPEGCDPVTGGGRFGECTLFAPREPGQLTITIRSYQISDDDDIDRFWDPYGDRGEPTLPSVIVTDYWCTGPDSPDGCAFAQDGPDLVPDSDMADVEPTEVQAGGTITFPTVPVLYSNSGTQPAQAHRIGYYISTADSAVVSEDSVIVLPRNDDGTIDTSGPETRLLISETAGELAPEDPPATVGSRELTIPLDIPRPDNGVGTYYLWAYVDDQRVVSELNEDDNYIRSGAITVIAENVAPRNIEFEAVFNAREREAVTFVVNFDDPGDAGEGYIYLWDFFANDPNGIGSPCDSTVYPEICGIVTSEGQVSAQHTYDNDGQYTVTVTIIDSGGLDGSGSLDVGVSNVAPTANDDAYSTDEDTPLTVGAPGILGNDTDPADVLTGAILVSGTSEGTLNFAGDGSFTYAPNADFNSSDSFTYQANDGGTENNLSNLATVTITVNPVNDAPVAVDDQYVFTQGTSLNVGTSCTVTDPPTPVGVLCNDSDPVEGDSLQAFLVTGPENGSLILNEDGSFTYTPDTGIYGGDSFTYVANDGTTDSNVATVTIGLPYLHVGLLSPWRPPSPPYSIKKGSAFPVRWQYADRVTGSVIDSRDLLPEVRLRSGVNCQTGEETNGLVTILTPGNSTYQYDDGQDIHQLNVDTNELTVNECYNVYTYSGLTGQLDGPFIFKIKK